MSSIESILKAKKLAEQGVLSCELGFLATPESVLDCICNGCGAAGAKFDFVPDTIYGMNIAPACNIHDWDYEAGVTEDDRKKADIRWRDNLYSLINLSTKNSRWRYIVKPLMCARVLWYYAIIRNMGADAFYS